MSSKFRFRNRFWFRETFIYASRSFTDDFLGNRFGFVCFDCPKDSSSQSVKPPVCAAETPAVIFLKKKKPELWPRRRWTVVERPSALTRAGKSTPRHVLHFKQQNWQTRKDEMVVCFLVLRWEGEKKSMLHGSISSVEETEEEEEEEVCCWGCGYTMSVPSIDFSWKSAG